MLRTEPLGAPGLYVRSQPAERALRPESMDVCGFVGISPRGPCQEATLPDGWRREDGPYVRQWLDGVFNSRRTVAVPVDSFEDYRRQFGGFEGPGRLPYAVAAFFEQGGRRAFVSRIVHDYADAKDDVDAMANGIVEGVQVVNGAPFDFFARNEGSWGDRLRIAAGFGLRPLLPTESDANGITLDAWESVSVGTLLLARFPGNVIQLRFADRVTVDRVASRNERRVDYAVPLVAVPETIEIVEAELLVDDGAGTLEFFDKLGLSPRHPRWLASVVCYDSELVYPGTGWLDSDLVPAIPDSLPSPAVLPAASDLPAAWLKNAVVVAGHSAPQFSGGRDRYEDLLHEDFFDPHWVRGNPDPGSGIHSFAGHREIASLVVPDLYCPEPLREPERPTVPRSLASSEFRECIETSPVIEPDPEPPGVNHLCLDPALPGDLETIIGLQRQLVEFAETTRDLVVLLDVPPGLTQSRLRRWRSRFQSSYAACYHPWVYAARADDSRDSLVMVNPSAVAAGIVAERENSLGVPFGPANALAMTMVNVVDPVSSKEHDELHQSGVNVFLKERDGIRLSAARTLSRDTQLRQLSVRRLLILLVRVLQRQTHWMVFEPNNRRLWRDVRRMLSNFLAEFYRLGAFRGATEADAFFVRCDEHTNPPAVIDAGQLVALIGVAPAEPLEFIVLKITRAGDSTLISEI